MLKKIYIDIYVNDMSDDNTNSISSTKRWTRNCINGLSQVKSEEVS